MVFVDIKSKKKKEIPVDIQYSISDVKACLNANGKFYIFANKLKKERGIFILELDEKDPCMKEHPDFIIRWKNSLEVGDANISILVEK